MLHYFSVTYICRDKEDYSSSFLIDPCLRRSIMEKYIKAAAAIIGIGALGYIGYRVATKQTVVRVRISAQSSTGPDAQPRKAEASE